MERIYLDHTATTPLDERVVEAMHPYFSGTFGNPSSIHQFGREAKQALERARESIADAIGAAGGEIFFTSGGTEANNMAIIGAVSAARAAVRVPHIVTSAAEHHAVLEPVEHLGEQGCSVSIVPVQGDGTVTIASVEKLLNESTCLVSVMTANNEVGSLSLVAELGSLCRKKGIVFHTDAVQALGKIPVDVQAWKTDLVSFSAHKIYGPKGIGALYIRQGTAIDPIIRGGGQERGRRPGTENVPLAVGFAKAVELAVSEMQQEQSRLASLRDQLETTLRSRYPGIIINGHPANRLSHILSVSFDHSLLPLEGELLVHNMDLEQVAVSSGSACTSGSIQPSHVLLAMGRDPETAKATIRFAFGRENHQGQIPLVVAAVERVVARMSAG